MPITFKSGNLLNSDAQALVNTVNCVGVMGKGIALEFRRRYPRMFRRYVEYCKHGRVQLGKPYADRELNRLIINFPTKSHWRARSQLRDVRAGLRYLRAHLDEWGVKSIAIPPLGCGHGGLDWNEVRPLIVRELGSLSIEIQVYEPHVPSDEGPFEIDHEQLHRSGQMSLFAEAEGGTADRTRSSRE